MAAILFVNDSQSLTAVLAEALTSAGHVVSIAYDAKQALSLLTHQCFDLVVTDLHMPEVDGIRLARIIRAGVYRTPGAVPIILVSATVNEGLPSDLLNQAGINEFIHLPCSLSFLTDRVAHHLARAQAQDDEVVVEQPGRQRTILAVDDEVEYLNLLAQTLDGMGYRLLRAENGAQAEAVLKSEHLDLVLLDYLLPDTNGIVLLRRIRELQPQALVVLLTGNGSQEVAVEALWAGAADYLEKPVSNKVLRKTIADVLLRGHTLQMANYLKEQIRLFREQSSHIESLKRLNEAIVGSLPDPICVLDGERRIKAANPGFWTAFGLSPEPGAARRLESVVPHPAVEKSIETVLRESRPVTGLEFNHSRGDGVVRSYRARLMPLLGSQGMLEAGPEGCALAVFQDITDERRASRMEEQLRSEQESTRMMGTFVQMLSGAAHELNNPLAVVMGMSDLGRSSADQMKPDQATEMFTRIFEQSKRCQAIVKDLTAFLAAERVQMRPGSIYDVLESALSARKLALETHHIQIRMPSRLPLPKASMNEAQIRRVFEQVFDNAFQAMKEGGAGGEIRISLGLEPGHPSDLVSVDIANNGPPIPEENLRRIFLPFVTSRGVGQGSGLGLSVCYGIVRNHGGKIAARNLDGGGCAFTVWLPVAEQTMSI